ncbi:endolytic transglycosylase MltG [Pararhizobium haloflavum]|uniref:endolytic transglycosylase MltG n=1 Tax=Pararhizobium haloflavum TaxID=2037914 RepID=UPI000C19E43A|nr:endolytic transglycosylase MltG [Pararhizobium haloflavum]
MSHRDATEGERGPIIPKSANEALRPEKAPQPPRRSRRARSQPVIFMNFVMSLVVICVLGAGAILYFGKLEYDSPGPLAQNTTFEVREGAGLIEIANSLERRNIVSDARIFRYGTEAVIGDDTLKHGEYEIRANASMREIMDLFRSGQGIQYAVTVPEGLTVHQIFERLAEHEQLTGDLPETMPAEGSLMPNTYNFRRGTTRQEVLDQMAAAQQEAIDQVWERRDEGLPIETKEEFVTLASIVEKETGLADERPRVAAVFINRLREGMRLQSDPTIIYGMFGGEGRPADRPIYRSDIDTPTDYNTYTIDGLPPGPIANPGRAALEAVANPSETDDLYFVADGTGGHAFARTLDEHNENVARWRRIRAEQEAAAAAEGEADSGQGEDDAAQSEEFAPMDDGEGEYEGEVAE